MEFFMRAKYILVALFTAIFFALGFYFYEHGKEQNNKPDLNVNLSALESDECFRGLLDIANCDEAFSVFKERLPSCFDHSYGSEFELEGPVSFSFLIRDVSYCFEKSNDWEKAKSALQYGLMLPSDQVEDSLRLELKTELSRLELPIGKCLAKKDFESAIKEVLMKKSIEPLRNFLSRETPLLVGYIASDNVALVSFDDIKKILSNSLKKSKIEIVNDSKEVLSDSYVMTSGWEDIESSSAFFTYVEKNSCVYFSGVLFDYREQDVE